MIGGGPTSGAPQLRIKSVVISHTGKTYKGIAVLNQRAFSLRVSGTQRSDPHRSLRYFIIIARKLHNH